MSSKRNILVYPGIGYDDRVYFYRGFQLITFQHPDLLAQVSDDATAAFFCPNDFCDYRLTIRRETLLQVKFKY
jgi:hypothetical protein